MMPLKEAETYIVQDDAALLPNPFTPPHRCCRARDSVNESEMGREPLSEDGSRFGSGPDNVRRLDDA